MFEFGPDALPLRTEEKIKGDKNLKMESVLNIF